ncbi:MvaI/BcnI family restriction endonuclease [Entomomonas moraniae]|uniref:MvaI/BcnI family restriction endonuclease n=1 Tax=Entomomonas moraniae TaxID=2213226 RepID=UPI001E6429FE|nr:MvaI/BcnI family restriction endonuclease [Entomomonas moraniae]
MHAESVKLQLDKLRNIIGFKEPNSSKQPDYLGIELKTTRQFSKKRSTIFAQVAEWKNSVIKSSAEMLDKYGYSREDSYKLYCTVRAGIANPQGLSFDVDLEKDILFEIHEIDGITLVWSGKLLRQRLLEKHKETFWIEAESFVNDEGIECFILKQVIHTKNPLLSQLLPLLKDRVITMDHLIKRSGKTNKVSEKGPLFKINSKNLNLLFPEPVYYEI